MVCNDHQLAEHQDTVAFILAFLQRECPAGHDMMVSQFEDLRPHEHEGKLIGSADCRDRESEGGRDHLDCQFWRVDFEGVVGDSSKGEGRGGGNGEWARGEAADCLVRVEHRPTPSLLVMMRIHLIYNYFNFPLLFSI